MIVWCRDEGPADARGAQQEDVLGARQGHQARALRPQPRALIGLQVPASCAGSAGMPRSRFSQPTEGHFRPWMLLASARLCHGQSDAQDASWVLAKQAGRKREAGRRNQAPTQKGGMVNPCYLGVPGRCLEDEVASGADRPVSRAATGVASGAATATKPGVKGTVRRFVVYQ